MALIVPPHHKRRQRLKNSVAWRVKPTRRPGLKEGVSGVESPIISLETAQRSNERSNASPCSSPNQNQSPMRPPRGQPDIPRDAVSFVNSTGLPQTKVKKRMRAQHLMPLQTMLLANPLPRKTPTPSPWVRTWGKPPTPPQADTALQATCG